MELHRSWRCAWTATFTYGATGVVSAVKKCARHPHNLSLHLPHAREDVWVKRVAPCKISINLGTVGRICMSSKYLQEPRHNLKERTRDGIIKESAGAEMCLLQQTRNRSTNLQQLC